MWITHEQSIYPPSLTQYSSLLGSLVGRRKPQLGEQSRSHQQAASDGSAAPTTASQGITQQYSQDQQWCLAWQKHNCSSSHANQKLTIGSAGANQSSAWVVTCFFNVCLLFCVELQQQQIIPEPSCSEFWRLLQAWLGLRLTCWHNSFRTQLSTNRNKMYRKFVLGWKKNVHVVDKKKTRETEPENCVISDWQENRAYLAYLQDATTM